ncbi:MAG: DUF488 family protein [bacterium]
METERQHVIYSIGHSTHPKEEFIQILQQQRIQCLVDVRRFPTSKKHPQFARENLAASLQQVNIDYIWLGELLGGFRTRGYEAYAETEAFKSGLEQLKDYGREKATAFMCAELLFFRCHRRFIAEKLIEQGWKVVHIMDQGKLYEHRGGRR